MEYSLPAAIVGKEVTIKIDTVDSDIPLLLSRTAMKNAGVKLDLENDTDERIKATVLGRAGKVTGKNKNWYNAQRKRKRETEMC